MPAEFTEVLPLSGFDRMTPTGGPGIVIPHKGAGLVIFDGGKHLKLDTVMKPALVVEDIKNPNFRELIADARHPSNANKSRELALLSSGALRLIKITANALVGVGAKVEAMNPRTRKAEAALKIIVLKQKRVKIAIRPVRVRDDAGVLVYSSRKPIDPSLLLDQMNAIWKPQANIVFELTSTDPVTIDLLKPDQPADITLEALKAAFVAKKDPAADLTFFMVRRAINHDNSCLGVIDAEAGFSLISDDRSDSTMAHEAGHFLGSLSESGKFSMRYGHQGTDPDLLMRAGGAGYRIPYSLVTDFNKGYRS
jgi:hypothetical protein